jgi:ribulose-phosphate 3-epimerase
LSQTVYFAPSILAADFTRLGEQIRAADSAGANRIHVDVMDGRFVPNITMGSVVVEAARRVTALPLDIHLMIVEPDHLLEAFAKAGANNISVHVEACPNLHRTLQAIKELGCRAGVAINPHTPAAALSEIMHMIDIILGDDRQSRFRRAGVPTGDAAQNPAAARDVRRSGSADRPDSGWRH